MQNIFYEISDDVNHYLNLNELTTLSTVSTNSFYRGLNNMKFNRFTPKERGDEILIALKSRQEVKLSELKESSNIIRTYENRCTMLYLAIWKGYDNIVEYLIRNYVYDGLISCSNEDYYNISLLHWAVEKNNIRIANSLIDRGIVDVNSYNNDGRTPLHTAILEENIEMVKLLLLKNADIYADDSDENVPFYYAARYNNNIEIVKLLITEGGKSVLNFADYDEGWTPLHFAVSNNNIEMVKLLVNIEDSCEETSPHHCSMKREICDVNYIDDFADPAFPTPLYIAVCHNNIEMVELLLKIGERRYDDCPYKYQYSEIDISIIDDENKTMLYRAAYNNNLEIVKLLIKRGALICEIDSPYREGLNTGDETPFDLAVKHNNTEMIMLLKKLDGDEKKILKNKRKIVTILDLFHYYEYNVESLE